MSCRLRFGANGQKLSAADRQEPGDYMPTVPKSRSVQGASPETPASRRAMAIVTLLFFMWGLLTSLNDILVPHLKAIFDLKYVEVMLIQFSFFSAYFIFAMPSGRLIEWVGYKRTMVLGLVIMGAGALLFVPAAGIPSFPLFLTALTVLGGGITVLQVSANPYVAVLGPSRTASSRLNLTQAFNSLGTTIAPLLGSLLILGGAPKSLAEMHRLAPAELQAYRLQEAASVKLPYLGLALAILILCLLIAKSTLPNLAIQRHDAAAGESIWKQSSLVLGAIAIFVYVGAEVSIGSFLVNYLNQPNIGALPEKFAARYVSLYWGAAMVGRFVGAALLRRVPTSRLLAIFASVASALVFASVLTSGHAAMWSILLVGLFNSIMFPSIFTLAIDGLGPLTGKGSGLLVTSIVGGAVIPVLQGALADRFGIHDAFILPALCYLYIIYFALRDSRRPSAVL